MPIQFMRRVVRDIIGVDLPDVFAVGNVFLPKDQELRTKIKKKAEKIVEGLKGLKFIGWRQVPVNNEMIGLTALSREPLIEQIFIASTLDFVSSIDHSEFFEEEEPTYELTESEFVVPKLRNAKSNADLISDRFESLLYLARRLISNSDYQENDDPIYICSLSSRTIVYKGQLTPNQLGYYFLDLQAEDFCSYLAMVHSRYSTNTFPSWERAQPLRMMCHNGEINTLRGNINWMKSREGYLKSGNPLFDSKDSLLKLFPVIRPGGSDSMVFDNVLEFLCIAGQKSLPEVLTMMIPEAWAADKNMTQEKRDYYQFNSTLMEPWDGPALIAFTDGKQVGACLDRNGLRPARYIVTADHRVILSSEVGVLPHIPTESIVRKGRLAPGKIFLIDFDQHRVVSDAELKHQLCSAQPYGSWLSVNSIHLESCLLAAPSPVLPPFESVSSDFVLYAQSVGCLGWRLESTTQYQRLRAFGFNKESLDMLLVPMVCDGYEALGSMGNDAALACLSEQPRSIFEFFKQMFAQITNPSLDPIREHIVMSLQCCIGPEGNVLQCPPEASFATRLFIDHPILSPQSYYGIFHISVPSWKPFVLNATMPVAGSLHQALRDLCKQAEIAIVNGFKLIIISDRLQDARNVAIPSLLCVGAVHQYLVRKSLRSRAGLIADTGDAREVHHFCCLFGFGCDVVFPYMVYDAIGPLREAKKIPTSFSDELLVRNFQKAAEQGVLKVMAKMGISTLQSYKGAQVFEALGLSADIMDECFCGCESRIGGISFDVMQSDMLRIHERAYGSRFSLTKEIIDTGDYYWRSKNGEMHLNHPSAIAFLQDAARSNSRAAFASFSNFTNKLNEGCNIRGQLDFCFENCIAIPIEEVESASDIVKRFATGAMSYGSISIEAHKTLAIAMNRIGGKSNTGEGGEDAERAQRLVNGDSARSAIKQVASARFGVDIFYLVNADQIQIKISQGAKPGEGGELPGHKVDAIIAKTRHSTPGVGLISPPPHHDIYSIEDIAQLIFDLKNANPKASISVKLVSEVGVGVVASGLVKGRADHLVISGDSGGTGASRWTGIKHAGLPWELGLAEAHQTLLLNRLRDRVVLQTDGQIRTGADVVKATLLGADEFGFATAPLIVLGCIMMRKCHLNTCPVGIATQDPILRAKFKGQPEHVMNYLFLVAEDARQIMARLGVRSLSDLVGRSDLLKQRTFTNSRTAKLDLSNVLHRDPNADSRFRAPACNSPVVITNPILKQLDLLIINGVDKQLALGKSEISLDFPINNTNRAVGTLLSSELTKKFGINGVPAGMRLHICFKGSAGQSFGAFVTGGVTLELEGDANDFVGKGLCGGRLIVYPPRNSSFLAEENILLGNVALYGATSGSAFFRGQAAERFCVRNSGAFAICEGAGDHCCEYMTGGTVIVLGKTGRNFAAGMSGGIAYVYDAEGTFPLFCNTELVELVPCGFAFNLNSGIDDAEIDKLKQWLALHVELTKSVIAASILQDFDNAIMKFIKVYPRDYMRAIEQRKLEEKGKIGSPDPNQCLSPSEKKLGNVEQRIVLDLEDLSIRPKVVEHPKKVRGFITYERQGKSFRSVNERMNDFKEIFAVESVKDRDQIIKTQAARCMDCGVPFCHQTNSGCPISNNIPIWNDLVFHNQWRAAFDQLMATNNFPEFTGRICPAPCEGACVLGIIDKPVAIKSIEMTIIDKAYEMGWMIPTQPTRTGKKIAIVGSGPAGLSAADQLNKVGHQVVVFEREDRVGGLLMYGVPNMKLDKGVVDRRVDIMAKSGILFETNVQIGKSNPYSTRVRQISVDQLCDEYDAILLATGATKPRDLNIAGRNLKGIHFAMDYLTANTKALLKNEDSIFNVAGKRVLVIGGGDTGNDCIGTAIRQKASSVTNFELMNRPPESRDASNPWPEWPRIYRVDYGHEEVNAAMASGQLLSDAASAVDVQESNDCRRFAILSKDFVDDGFGNVCGLKTVRVKWYKDENGSWRMAELEGTSRIYSCDVVLLAMGFAGPEMLNDVVFAYDNRGNFKDSNYKTNVPKIYAAGDCRRGQSLVVWGIAEGRQAAREIDRFLLGSTDLPN